MSEKKAAKAVAAVVLAAVAAAPYALAVIQLIKNGREPKVKPETEN